MAWKRALLGDVQFGESEQYLAFKYTFAMILMWAGQPLLALFIAGDVSGANQIGLHGFTVKAYFALVCVLIWALRGRQKLFKPVVWVYALSSFLVHVSGFMLVPADELRLVWFYSLIAGVYILLGRRAGAAFTVGAVAVVLLGNAHQVAPVSSRGMGTFLASLVSLSVMFHAFTQRTMSFYLQMVRSNDRLRHLSEHDPLTGVLNGRAFAQSCEGLIRLAARHRASYAVLFIDLDHFKRVNDHYGHDAGDAVLKAVAGILRCRVRDSDLVGRVGGEEFVVFLPDTDTQGALRLADELRRGIEECRPQVGEGVRLGVTASIGVAVASHDDGGLAALQKRADEAMYKAKAAGRNRVTLFSVAGS